MPRGNAGPKPRFSCGPAQGVEIDGFQSGFIEILNVPPEFGEYCRIQMYDQTIGALVATTQASADFGYNVTIPGGVQTGHVYWFKIRYYTIDDSPGPWARSPMLAEF